MYRLGLDKSVLNKSGRTIISKGPGGLAKSLQALNKQQSGDINLNFLLESLPVGVVVINICGNVEFSNEKARLIFNHSLNGYPWAQLVEEVINPHANDGCEVTLVSGLKIRVDTQPLPDRQGQMLVVTDLTETLRMQSQLAHHKRLSDLGNMVAALAHQIRTPITTALLYAHEINQLTLEENRSKFYISKMISQLEAIEKQIKDMLAYAQLDQPMDDDIEIDFLPKLVVQSLEEFARSRQVILHIASTRPSKASLRGNRSLLTSVLSNLVVNAIEASSKNMSVVVGILSTNDHVSFYVSDTGTGISFENQKKIFEPFFTTKSTGTGLGLAVAKRVVNLHGGILRVESDLGIGTTMLASFKRQVTMKEGSNEELARVAS